jgi:membrane-associated phospholipid phosphatase
MGRRLAQMISILTHPLVMLSLILIIQMWALHYAFMSTDPKFKGILLINVVAISFIMPAIAILLMRFMQLVPSLEMEDRKSRIGPLIVTAVFYLWLYKNLLDNPDMPSPFVQATLGAIIALFICFFINLFSKISLHTAGVGGVLGMIVLLMLNHSASTLMLRWGASTIWTLDLMYVLVGIILLSGIVASARLYLKAHTLQEVTGGLFIGIAAQLIAFLFTPSS